jgi:hypothetical protein
MSAYYSSIHGGGTGSRSRRAQIAELQGKMPASRAAQTWGFKSAKDLRAVVPTNEWHHVGKYANCVDYYDVAGFIEDLSDFSELAGIRQHLTKRGIKVFLAEAVAQIVASNLKPIRIFRCRNKSRLNRVNELRDRHGIEIGWRYQGPLSGPDLEAEIRRLKAEQIETKRALFKTKIKNNLRPSEPRRHDSTFKPRLYALAAKFGNYRLKRIASTLSNSRIPLTEANFLEIQKSVCA